MRMNTTLVINSKGGSGKTTIATNLASYFASQDIPTTVMDYDPQGSSLHWLRVRNQPGARIYGANAAPQKGGRIRSVEMHVLANRVRSERPVYQPLERFLNSLGLPFLTRIGDSDVYVKAAEAGIGIFEMPPSAAAAECAEFMPIVEWVCKQVDSGTSVDGKVVDLAHRRWMERTPGLSSIGSRS